jgi:MFS family permease
VGVSVTMTKTRAILFANFCINMGIGLIMPITTLYIHQDLHESLVVAGSTLMGFSLAMTVGNLFAGWLFDHWQPRQVLIVGNTLTVAALLTLTFIHGWPVFVGLVVAYGLGLGLLNAAMNGYIAYQQRIDANIFNQGYWIASVGMGIATASSGFLYHQGIQWVFGGAALLFILTFAVVGGLFRPIVRPPRPNAKQPRVPLTPQVLRNVTVVSVMLVIIWIGYEQWNSNVSVLMLREGVSVEKYSLLFTINTGLIVLIQPIVTRLIQPSWRSDLWKVISGALLFGVSYLVIINADAYWRFVVGMTVVTMGEILALTAAPSLMNRFATDRNRGMIQSLASLSGSLGRSIGPVAGSALITLVNYNWTFLILFVLHVVGIVGLLTIRRARA